MVADRAHPVDAPALDPVAEPLGADAVPRLGVVDRVLQRPRHVVGGGEGDRVVAGPAEVAGEPVLVGDPGAHLPVARVEGERSGGDPPVAGPAVAAEEVLRPERGGRRAVPGPVPVGHAHPGVDGLEGPLELQQVAAVPGEERRRHMGGARPVLRVHDVVLAVHDDEVVVAARALQLQDRVDEAPLLGAREVALVLAGVHRLWSSWFTGGAVFMGGAGFTCGARRGARAGRCPARRRRRGPSRGAWGTTRSA